MSLQIQQERYWWLKNCVDNIQVKIAVTDFKNGITKDYTSKTLQKKLLKKEMVTIFNGIWVLILFSAVMHSLLYSRTSFLLNISGTVCQ